MRPFRRSLSLVLGALCIASAASAWPGDERRVEQKRVVVRVDTAGDGSNFDYVFVDHRDGQPVVLETELAERGYLGILLLDLTPELRQHFGASSDAGVMISRVEPDSPAAIAGVLAGDILIEIDGTAVRSATGVAHRIAEGAAGMELLLELRRGGDQLALTATLTTRERRQFDLGGLLRLPGEESRVRAGSAINPTTPLIELDPESIGRALVLIREHFDSSRWQEQVELLGGDRHQIEVRIREVEERLRELERRLQGLPE